MNGMCSKQSVITGANINSKSNASQLHKNSVELSKVNDKIKQLKKHDKQYLSDIKSIKSQLKSLNENIERAKKDCKQCSTDIKTAKLNLSKSLKIYNSSSSESSDLGKVILGEWQALGKIVPQFSYEQNPFEYKIRRKSLERKTQIFRKTKKNVLVSTRDLQKWKQNEKKLLKLQQCKNDLVVHLEDLLEKKKKLLKDAVSKRCGIEKGIKVLNDNAKTIQMLMNRIVEANKQEQEQKQKQGQLGITEKQQEKRRQSFAWPVNGKVIVKFGKIKHIELDAYVISNGIKVDAGDASGVKSIGSGRVVFTGQFHSYGNVVIIDHGNSVFSIYGLLDRVLVKEGQQVLKGDVIADLGKKENRILYLEIRRDNVPVDPMILLSAQGK